MKPEALLPFSAENLSQLWPTTASKRGDHHYCDFIIFSISHYCLALIGTPRLCTLQATKPDREIKFPLGFVFFDFRAASQYDIVKCAATTKLKTHACVSARCVAHVTIQAFSSRF